MTTTRRTFIKAGLLGTGALVVAGAHEGWTLRACSTTDAALSPAGHALFAAMMPALLNGVVPSDGWTPAMMPVALRRVESTIATLSPAAQEELRQLLCLLDRPLGRLLLTGSAVSWASVTPARARAILSRWRYSRSALLVSAYHALHDITLAAWYAEPAHWAAIGYPGPPDLVRAT